MRVPRSYISVPCSSVLLPAPWGEERALLPSPPSPARAAGGRPASASRAGGRAASARLGGGSNGGIELRRRLELLPPPSPRRRPSRLPRRSRTVRSPLADAARATAADARGAGGHHRRQNLAGSGTRDEDASAVGEAPFWVPDFFTVCYPNRQMHLTFGSRLLETVLPCAALSCEIRVQLFS